MSPLPFPPLTHASVLILVLDGRRFFICSDTFLFLQVRANVPQKCARARRSAPRDVILDPPTQRSRENRVLDQVCLVLESITLMMEKQNV